MLTLKLLFLLGVANGTPILLAKWLGDRWDWPIDGGFRFWDRRPILGRSKTWRGLCGAIVLTAFGAAGVGFSFAAGAVLGATAMLGDMFSSFVKRRLGIPSSGMAFGLDQIPECAFPLWVLRDELALSPGHIAGLTIAFLLLELAVSRILYAFHIRRQPY